MPISKIFQEKFGKKPEKLFRSPGRVNLIGEHTDYHDGYVLPTAINLEITWAVARRKDDIIRGYTEKFDKMGQFSLSDRSRTKFEWLLYLQGVVEILKKRRKGIGGVDFAIASTIPVGSGLSSSSSLATGFTFILNELFGLGLTRQEIARIACEAEWWYGTTGGIMDQFCIANSKKGSALWLDTRSLDHEYIEFPSEIEMVVLETTTRHKQINSPFDLRKEQAQKVVDIAKKMFFPQDISKLRDVTVPMLATIKPIILEEFGPREGGIIFRRALHPITENWRVQTMKKALIANDYKAMSRLLFACHQSLRDNYEVSCPELDMAVEIARGFGGLLGARMIGGGFGGCTLNLVKKGQAIPLATILERKFNKKTGLKGKAYLCSPSDGVSVI